MGEMGNSNVLPSPVITSRSSACRRRDECESSTTMTAAPASVAGSNSDDSSNSNNSFDDSSSSGSSIDTNSNGVGDNDDSNVPITSIAWKNNNEKKKRVRFPADNKGVVRSVIVDRSDPLTDREREDSFYTVSAQVQLYYSPVSPFPRPPETGPN